MKPSLHSVICDLSIHLLQLITERQAAARSQSSLKEAPRSEQCKFCSFTVLYC